MHRLLIGLVALLAAASSYAANRYVATTGADVGDCSNVASPCLTLQYAINQAVASDTINVAAGTYVVAGLVTVNKTLTLLGAQAGVDARTRAASESVLSNSQGMLLSASNVVVDGFQIRDSVNTAFTGYGVVMGTATTGTQILNNIFQKNIVGLGLANAGPTQVLVRHNLFVNNNESGSASGTAIYTDEFVAGGALTSVLIEANAFTGNANAGVGVSNAGATPFSFIGVTHNTFDSNGRGIYVLGASAVTIQGNTITNTTTPTDGGQSSAISAFGAVTGMSVVDNTLQGGDRNGIRVIDAIGNAPNTGIEVHGNNITGFAVDGLINEDVPRVNATCNWWGASSGPTNPGNPGGTGDVVIGDVAFAPWLLEPAPTVACAIVSSTPPIPTLSPLAMLLTMLALGALGYATLRSKR